MTYQGTVHNGVVVFAPGVQLPEGSPVRVEVLDHGDTKAPIRSEDDPLWRMAELAGETGIPDLSVNIDHYLYGHPKVTDGK